MRPLIIFFLLFYFAFAASGQNVAKTDPSLKFNQRYTKCERKWVVMSQADTDKSYLFGFIYIDAQAGFTFDMKGTFLVSDNGRYLADTSISKNQSMKYRIARNWRNVAVLPASRFNELHIKPQPWWIKIYYNYTDTVQHNYRWGFIYNDLDECDTALVYLYKAYKVNPHYPGLEFEIIYAYNALKSYDDAITIINSALANDPKNVMFYRELGYAYLQKMNYDKSVAAYNQGIVMCTDKENDTKAEMAINMAKDYKLMGKQDEYAAWGAKAKGWATVGSAIYKFIVSLGF
jgi:tetratricopeptide (TPR) repeat protein